MDENLALEEKAAAGDSVSIEVLRSMRSESQRELEAVNAQSQYTSNGDNSSFDMEEDLQENMMEPPVLVDSEADNEADNDRLPLPMWQTLLPMQELGIYLLYSKQLMVWEDNEVPMKNRGLLKDTNVAQHIYRMHVEDSPVIQQAEARKMKILDADYSAVDLADH
jgi:hypothetical protein